MLIPLTISLRTPSASPASVFYIQAWQDQRTVTVIIEKTQLQSLAVGVEQFIAQIMSENPDLEEASGDYVEDKMHIHPPVEPLFRVGEIGLGYEKDRDSSCFS
jgi:uncharacterized repeat protein (TIGR03847 family)